MPKKTYRKAKLVRVFYTGYNRILYGAAGGCYFLFTDQFKGRKNDDLQQQSYMLYNSHSFN